MPNPDPKTELAFKAICKVKDCREIVVSNRLCWFHLKNKKK